MSERKNTNSQVGNLPSSSSAQSAAGSKSLRNQPKYQEGIFQLNINLISFFFSFYSNLKVKKYYAIMERSYTRLKYEILSN